MIIFPVTNTSPKITLAMLVLADHDMHSALHQACHREPASVGPISKENIVNFKAIVDLAE